MLSFFEIPKRVRKRLDFFRSRFFWQSDGHKKKYRLTKWNIICRPKDQGGLGIEVLDLKNKCLLSKWLYKLLTERGVWHELVTNKYLHSKSLSQVKARVNDSPFWKGLIKNKEDFFSRGSFKVGSGEQTRFWEDTWLGDTPLSQQYPSLYNIVHAKQASVATVMGQLPLNIGFRQAITGNREVSWTHLCSRLINIHLTTQPDTFVWKLTKSGIFSVKSMYLDYMDDHTKFLRKYIWKIKVPLKIRIFMWFLLKRVLLTKDNLARRNWQGSKKCCFCDKDESIQHLFLSCPLAKIVWQIVYMAFNITPPTNITNMFGNWLSGVAKVNKAHIRVGVCALLWAVWNTRNDYIFNKAKSTSFMQVVPMATHWIRMWSYLQPMEKRKDMNIGCSRLERVARDLYSQFSWRFDHRLTC
jgi:hypothetical protein